MKTINVSLIASDEGASLAVRVIEEGGDRAILRGSLAELRNDTERKCFADIIAALNAFVQSQE